MRGLKTSKYMTLFTTFGYIIGFAMILWSAFLSDNKLYIVVGVLFIFLARTVGYGIDRIIEYMDEKKEG